MWLGLLLTAPIFSLAQKELPYKLFDSVSGSHLRVPYLMDFHKDHAVIVYDNKLHLFKQGATNWLKTDDALLLSNSPNGEYPQFCAIHGNHVISMEMDARNDSVSYLKLYEIVKDKLVFKDSIKGPQFISPLINDKYIGYLKPINFGHRRNYSLTVMTYSGGVLEKVGSTSLQGKYGFGHYPYGVLNEEWVHFSNPFEYSLNHFRVTSKDVVFHSQSRDSFAAIDSSILPYSFDASKDWLATGCYLCASSNAKGFVSTYKYDKPSDKWQWHSAIENNEVVQPGFGIDIALHGNTLFTTGPDTDSIFVDDDSTSIRQLIYRYELAQGKWTFVDTILPYLEPSTHRIYLEGISYDGYSLMASSQNSIAGMSLVSYSFAIHNIPDNIVRLHHSTGRLWPNPVQDLLYHQFDSDESLQLEVFNMTGQLVYRSTGLTSSGSHSLSQISPGLYLARLLSNNEVLAAQRIVKN